jgi:RHS repeat-associated protein
VKPPHSASITTSVVLCMVFVCSGCYETRSNALPNPNAGLNPSPNRPLLSVPKDSVLPTELSEGVAAGNTKGALQVTSDGDLAYDFPLWVPSGRNGVQPQLSLAYRSRGANGLLGVGWSVGGLSQITRCAKTRAQNGDSIAVKFDSTDVFCLDGQQLVAITGTYGGDGTEYRTERDTFSKIISGAAGCPVADTEGPTCFKVFLKSGRILTYGHSASDGDSSPAIEGQRISRTVPVVTAPNAVTDTSQVVRYAWAMARGEDRFGNGVNYHYVLNKTFSAEGEPTYEFRPDLITYTDTADKTFPALKSVKFIYESRPDIRTFYVAGLRMTYAQRLTQIDVTGPNPISTTVVRRYKLGYRNDSVTQHSLLSTITECTGETITDSSGAVVPGSSACKAPLSFEWELGSVTFRDIDTGIHHVTQAMSGSPSGEGGTAPPVARGGALTSWMTSTSSTDRVQHVAYIRGDGDPAGDGNLYEVYLHPGQQPWAWHGMTALRAASGAALTSWASTAGDVHVAYVGEDRHVHVQSKHARQPWLGNEDATTASGAPNAQPGALTSWLTVSDNLQHIAFIGGDKHIYELYTHPGQKAWSVDNATRAARAPFNAQSGALTSWVSSTDDLQHIAYIDGNGHVEELYLKVGTGAANWAFDDATQTSRAPKANNGALTSWVSSTDDLQHIAYIDGNGHVEELYLKVGTGAANWAFDDTSANPSDLLNGGILKRLTVADINGTGLDDVLLFTNAVTTNQFGEIVDTYAWNYHQNLGYRSITQARSPSVFDKSPVLAVSSSVATAAQLEGTSFVDVDRDGHADMIMYFQVGSGAARLCIATTPTWSNPFSCNFFDKQLSYGLAHNFPPSTRGFYLADIDGNGFPDPFYGFAPNDWAYDLNSGTAGMDGPLESHLPKTSGTQNIFAVDVDASGRPAIMLRTPAPTDGSAPVGLWYEATRVDATRILELPKNVALVAGESFLEPHFPACDPPRDFDCGFADLFVDLNGDGAPDAISYNKSLGGNPWIARNTANGFLDRVEIHLAAPPDMTFGGFPTYWGPPWSGYKPDPGVAVADLNSDRKQDIVLTSGSPFVEGVIALLAGDDDFQTPVFLRDQDGAIIPLPDDAALATFADVNGDGLPDLVEVVDGELHVFLHMGKQPDVITRVVEGMKEDHTISWTPISNPAIHQSASTCTFPLVCVKNSIWVVTDLASPDPSGGIRHLSYTYVNGRSDGLGGGWLGFDQRQESDSATGIVSLTTYDNFTQKSWLLTNNQIGGYSYPFAGLPQSQSFSVSLDNGRQFSNVRTTSYQFASGGTSSLYSVLACQVTEKQSEASPQNLLPFRQIAISYQYDGLPCTASQGTPLVFGNVTSVSRATGDGYLTTTSSQYESHPDTWLVDLATRVAQTETTPTGESTTGTTIYNYDANTGALIEQTIEPSADRSLKLVRHFSRDNTGLVTSIQETSADQQRTTKMGYDAVENAFLAYVSDPLSFTEQYAYHPSFGVLVGFRDENNNTTQWQLDGFGRARTEKPPDGANLTISYLRSSATDYRVTARQAGGQEITSLINRFGLESNYTRRGFDGRQILIDKDYDSVGRLARISNPYFAGTSPSTFTSVTYDALGRLRKRMIPDGSVNEQDYSGLSCVVFDENHNQKTILKDQLLRTILVSERANDGHAIQTRYGYGPFGVLESVIDPAGNKITAKYDVRGRRTEFVDPDSGRELTTWNAFDESSSETDALGNVFRYKRDLLGRPVRIKRREGTTTIVWDQATNGLGKIATAISSDGIITSFTFDSLSRIASKKIRAARRDFEFGYAYDPLGRLATVRYPIPDPPSDVPPFVASFDYTQYGHLRAVNDASSGSPTNLWKNTERNEFDQVTAEVSANGAVTSRQFDFRGRLQSLTTTVLRLPVQDLTYQYFANGNLQSSTDGLTHVVEGYRYDTLDRLTNWNVNKNDNQLLRQQFEYNDIGNLEARNTLVGAGGNLAYGYSGVHAGPHAVTSVNRKSYSYDGAGRETIAPSRYTKYLSWGLPKRIVGATLTSNFKYDFLDQRVLALRSDSTQVVTVDRLFERASKANHLGTNTYYVRAGNRVLAAVTWNEVTKKRSVRYLHDDRLGSIAAITDAAGGLTETRSYDPFGTPRRPDDPSVLLAPSSLERLAFAERETDAETGLVNMIGRLYDARLGRFTTPDPFVTSVFLSQSYNRYSYALNNPLRWVDPTGLQTQDQSATTDQGWDMIPLPGGWGFEITHPPTPTAPNIPLWSTAAGTSDDGPPGGTKFILPPLTLPLIAPPLPVERPYTGPTISAWKNDDPLNGIPNKDVLRAGIQDPVVCAVGGPVACSAVAGARVGQTTREGMELMSQGKTGQAAISFAMAAPVLLDPAYNRGDYITPEYYENRAIILSQDSMCQYCGAQKSTTADHIGSVYAADSTVGVFFSKEQVRQMVNELQNLAGSCPSCNSSKGASLPGNLPGYWRPTNPSPRMLQLMRILGTWRDE